MRPGLHLDFDFSQSVDRPRHLYSRAVLCCFTEKHSHPDIFTPRHRKLESTEDLLGGHPLARAPDLDARLGALAHKQALAAA